VNADLMLQHLRLVYPPLGRALLYRGAVLYLIHFVFVHLVVVRLDQNSGLLFAHRPCGFTFALFRRASLTLGSFLTLHFHKIFLDK